jgi:hypothetical protein
LVFCVGGVAVVRSLYKSGRGGLGFIPTASAQEKLLPPALSPATFFSTFAAQKPSFT